MMDIKYQPLIPFVLVLWHFLCDWVYQSHEEAVNKSLNPKIRTWHCVKYTVPFLPLLWVFGLSYVQLYVSAVILFVTHFFIDSYVPVVFWARYLRRAPELIQDIGRKSTLPPDLIMVVNRAAIKKNMRDMFNTPLGAVLLITMDQFFHICCLLPIMIMIQSNQ